MEKLEASRMICLPNQAILCIVHDIAFTEQVSYLNLFTVVTTSVVGFQAGSD
jgi:hypothetical protein